MIDVEKQIAYWRDGAMNAFNLEGRYPESLTPPPTLAQARAYLTCAGEVFR